MTKHIIGNNIRRLRFENGELKQSQLAEMVGVARQTIIALERGYYAPSLELAMCLAAVFECTVDEIFHWIDPQSPPISKLNRN